MELSLPVWLGSSLGTRTHLASTHLERECSLQAICSPGALYLLGTQDLDGRLATKLISSNSSPNMKQGAEMEDHATRHRQSTIAELSPAMPSTKGQSEKQAGHASLLTQRQSLTQVTSSTNTGSHFMDGKTMNPGCLGFWMRKHSIAM